LLFLNSYSVILFLLLIKNLFTFNPAPKSKPLELSQIENNKIENPKQQGGNDAYR